MNLCQKIILLISVLSFFLAINPVQIRVDADTNNLIFESITSKDGLSQNIIDCIIQDNYGYMWFGTLAGLNKYDGMNFTIYNTFLNPSLYNVYINTLYITKDNVLWVGTQFGLYRYNPETDTFTAYLNEPGNSNTISNDNIRAICEDSSGLLWIGTDNVLNVFDREKNTFVTYIYNPNDAGSISNNAIKTIYENYDGKIWIGTEGGLNLFHREDETFTVYTNDSDDPDSISNDAIKTIYKDSRGIVWIGTTNGLNRYNSETNTFTVYLNDPDNNSISGNFITSICEDDNGNLWIGTRSGLNQLNVESMTFINYRYDENNLHSINNDNITALYKDNTGILWIGTIDGINTLNQNEQAFKYYYGTVDDFVAGILKAGDNNLWLWDGDDLVLFNNDSKSVEKLYPGVFEATNYTYTNPTLCDICLGKDGCIWFGTIYYGLKKFDPVTNTTTTYVNEPGNNNSLKDDSIVTLYADHSGIIWIGTGLGLCSYDSDTQKFTQYQDDSKYPDAISSERIYSIYETADNNIWFGTESDVYMLDHETGQVKLAISGAELGGGTSDTRIETIYQDREGLLWIGSGYGLYSYDIENKELISYDLGDLTLNDLILNIVEDNNGDIWFSNREGLWRLSRNGNVSKYELNNGLVSNIFCENAGCKMDDGELLFGTMGGLISFYPEDIKINTTAPKVLINKFSLIDKQITLDKPIEDIDEITLSYSNNSFIIDFVALDYNSPEDDQYAYILEGFDDDWNYCGANESFTKYTNLSSGQYIFRVKAANSDGVWNEEGVSLKIIITSPFWQEWWFIVLMAMAALFLVIMVIKYRTHALHMRAQVLEHQVEQRTNLLAQKAVQLEQKTKLLDKEIKQHEISEEKLKEEIGHRVKYTRALVHELKTPLTPLVAASDFLASNLQEEPFHSFSQSIYNGATNLSAKIDTLLDLARGELGMLKLEYTQVSIQKLITDIYEYTKLEAERNGQVFIMDISPDLPVIQCDEDRVRQVLLNLINNAFKFTPRGGKIFIRAKEDKHGVTMQVEDSGQGIPEEEQKYLFQPYKRLDSDKAKLSGLGIGLSLVKMTVELHGGRVWVTSQKGKGSIFSFYLPLKPLKQNKTKGKKENKNESSYY
jgi:signal transduction histidine kinase/ligand-binding sensor domain-containing protein